MGTLIVLAVIGLGVFLGIVLVALLRMAQSTDQIYDCMLRSEEISYGVEPCISAGIRSSSAHQKRRGAAAERIKRLSGGALITPRFAFRGPSGPNSSVLFVSRPY